jgi:hypothetical protein
MKIVARPWQPQDLIDDLQSIIDEESDNYLNDRRTTLCIARDYLKEHFAEQKWIPVTERLPEDGEYLAYTKCTYGNYVRILRFAKDGRKVNEYDFDRDWENVWYLYDSEWGHIAVDSVTHWMPLPEPPKGE